LIKTFNLPEINFKFEFDICSIKTKFCIFYNPLDTTIIMEFNDLFIDGTPKTPQIDMNQLTGELLFTGKSMPENAAKIYEPVLKWVEQYILNARPTTNVRLDLEYINTASSLWLAKILKGLARINGPDYVLIINLYLPIEDFDEMKEFGDITDAFLPISGVFQGAIPSIGIKLYCTNDSGEIIKDRQIFI
jgi:hypothetical protein